ncbi:MAG: hypothetical protein AAB250_02345 [Bdellovibrionota bacterium]
MSTKNNGTHGSRANRGHEEKDHHRAGSLYKADWWVDHLEAEIEPNLAEDLELLLKNSKEDKAILASLKRTRQAIKASGDVAMPESGHYYNDLHNKIMAAIDFEEIPQLRREKHEIATHAKSKRYSGFAWQQGFFGAVGMAMMIALISWVGMRDDQMSTYPSNGVTMVDSPNVASIESSPSDGLERKIATVNASFSDDVNAFESEQEMVEEAAIQKLSQLSKEQVDELYRSLRQ